MAFFDPPSDQELSSEVRQMLNEHQRLTDTLAVSPTWKAYGCLPKVVEARLNAFQNLHRASRFSPEARNVAVMPIAHAKRCQGCFAGAQCQLDRLGFDEVALDRMCANPGRNMAFSKEEILEIIGFAAYWTMNMGFTQSANAALAEE